MFDEKFEAYWREQVRGAEGQRKEMLGRDLTGTKILLQTVLLPVFGTFDGLVLEHEMTSLSGVKIYGDVYCPRLRTVFEEEHYVTHAEKTTRGRFSFERARARSMAALGLVYYPYGRDELEKKPDWCRRDLYEFIGRVGSASNTGLMRLPVYEREVVRCALYWNDSFDLAIASQWLQLGKETTRKILSKLEAARWIAPVGGSEKRCHRFMLTGNAVSLIYGDGTRVGEMF